jgi:ABC-type molybdate transport system substrate-binding protein
LEEYDLRVYSAGAVAPPLKRVIDMFENKLKVQCSLSVGKAHELLAEIASSKLGDVFACGVEYILDDAEDQELVLISSIPSHLSCIAARGSAEVS